MRLHVLWLAAMLGVCGQAQGNPPEIVASTSAGAVTSAVFRVAPLSAPLLARVKTTSWRPGCPVPPEDLRELTLSFWDFGGRPATGTLIVNQDVSAEVTEIFRELFRHGFLIERMQPVEEYGASDGRSMEANNTSAFNCRDITGRPGAFSNHSWGRAIDINPLTNPYVKDDKVLPAEGRRFLDRARAYPGAILDAGFVVTTFHRRGWTWGGSWRDRKDYQHFEK